MIWSVAVLRVTFVNSLKVAERSENPIVQNVTELTTLQIRVSYLHLRGHVRSLDLHKFRHAVRFYVSPLL